MKTFDFFNIGATAYDPVNSYLTMLASRKSYYDTVGRNVSTNAQFQQKARTLYIKWGFGRVNFIENKATNTNSIVASNRNMVLIVFRGAETRTPGAALQNWIISGANIKQVDGGRNLFGGSKVKIHYGFKTAAESVIHDIQADLTKRSVGAGPDSRKPIVITGHSLGGALATLCAFNLKQAGYPVHSLFAHGNPMVGDPVFAAEFAKLNLQSYRTVHKGDIASEYPQLLLNVSQPVTTVGARVVATMTSPPNLIKPNLIVGPYQHVPSELLYIDQAGVVRSNPTQDFIERDRGPLNTNDHNTLIYTNKLYAAIPQGAAPGLKLQA